MADNKQDISFEEALAKLNDIATKLKAKDISLEDTIKYFLEVLPKFLSLSNAYQPMDTL